MKAKLIKETLSTTLFNKKDRLHKNPWEYFCGKHVIIEFGIGEYGNYAGVTWKGKNAKEGYEEFNLSEREMTKDEFIGSIIEEIRYQDEKIS